MSDIGIISPDERTELIGGEIILMASQNPPHVLSTKLCYDYLLELLKNQALVRNQAPIWLSDRNEPEPDISVVRPPLERYYEQHPEPDDVFWIIEVSDATLNYDLNKKSKVYARANILEYWVIDVIAQEVHVFRGLVDGAYTIQDVYSKDVVVRPLAFPEIEVPLMEFLP